LQSTFAAFGVEEYVLSGTVDGASYFPPAFSLGVPRPWILNACCAHMLHLSVRARPRRSHDELED
jgi:hypothetical protein